MGAFSIHRNGMSYIEFNLKWKFSAMAACATCSTIFVSVFGACMVRVRENNHNSDDDTDCVADTFIVSCLFKQVYPMGLGYCSNAKWENNCDPICCWQVEDIFGPGWRTIKRELSGLWKCCTIRRFGEKVIVAQTKSLGNKNAVNNVTETNKWLSTYK